ncbi:unnamed protein product [Bursaphelenchus xylophilus]|uniref:Metalloendopeptidase n=1 Tax=Bursaphelenchus xylophilus TaxID=6326 RepID=A0A1I7SAD3_BURXY|nr:unnamed protein product [Bursaphelenchus xylophilus]CAG9084038.1 unnamed protein product [Bursaphelenchus xylophilus]
MIVWVLLFMVTQIDAKRGSRIDIYKQNGGDILQMKPGKSVWGKMRNALPTNSLNRWTEYRDENRNYVLPFTITGKFEPDERTIIFGAMRAIERNTCLKFKRRERERDYVDIRNERNEGCYTSVGRHRGKNVVMLEANNIATCAEHDIVIHEFMHTIGLWHEHMRYDRDKYIKVHFDRIEPMFYSQFEKISKQESTTYGVEYDYRSVMHYSKDAFAERPGDITMETVDKSMQDVIGRVTDASPSDYIKICSIYKCGQCMGKPFGKKKSGSRTSPEDNRSSNERKKVERSCGDSFFCSHLLKTQPKEQICNMEAYQRWCCASCS